MIREKKKKPGFFKEGGRALMGLATAPLQVAGKIANKTINPMVSRIASSIAKPMVRRAVDRATDDRGEVTLDSPLGRHRFSNIKVDPKMRFSFNGLRPQFSTNTRITLNDELTIPRSQRPAFREGRPPSGTPAFREGRPPSGTPAFREGRPPSGTPAFREGRPPPQPPAHRAYVTPFNAEDNASIRRAQERGSLARVNVGSAPEFNRQMMPPQPTGPLAARFVKPDNDYFVDPYRRPEEDVRR